MDFVIVLAGILVLIGIMVGVIFYSKRYYFGKGKLTLSIIALLALIAGWIYYKKDVILQTVEDVKSFILDKKWYLIGGAVLVIILFVLILKIINHFRYSYTYATSSSDDVEDDEEKEDDDEEEDEDEDEDDNDEDEDEDDNDDNNIRDRSGRNDYHGSRSKGIIENIVTQNDINWTAIILAGMGIIGLILIILLALIFS